MIEALTLLVLCQLAGESLGQLLSVPLPGPVIGLVLLLAGLVWRGRVGVEPVSPDLRRVANGLLSALALLFVPAGVGVVTQLDVLSANWVAIAAAILVSTAIGLAVTGWTMQRLSRQGG